MAKPESRLNNLITILFAGWIIFVVFVYFKEHPYYWQFIDLNSKVLKFYTYAIIYFALSLTISYGLLIFLKKKFKEIKLSLIKIVTLALISITILSTLVFQIKEFATYEGEPLIQTKSGQLTLKNTNEIGATDTILIKKGYKIFDNEFRPSGWLPEMNQYIEKYSYPKYIWNILIKIIQQILFFIITSVLLMGIGGRILDIFDKNKIKGIDRYLISIALGTITFTLFLFIAGALGQLNMWALILFVIISIIFGYKKILKVADKIILEEFNFNIKIKSITFFVLTIFFALFANFLLRNVMPVPIGSDDFSLYLKIPKLLAEEGKLIKGFGSYPAGLLYSIGYILHDSSLIPAMTRFLFFILSMAALFSFLRKFISDKTSILITCISGFIPSLIYQSATYIKVEILILFFALTAFICFSYWLKEKDRSLNSLLVLGLLITGFLFSIKYSSIIFIFTIIVMLVYYLFNTWTSGAVFFFLLSIIFAFNKASSLIANNISESTFDILGLICVAAGIMSLIIGISERKKDFTKKIIVFSLSIAILILPSMPWMAKNFIETDSPKFNLHTFLFGQTEEPKLKFGNREECLNKDRSILDYSRIIGEDNNLKLNKLILYPWYLTMNTGLKHEYLDIGFLFLAFIPILIFTIKKEKYSKYLIIFSIPFYIFWAIIGRGVIWYGIAGLPILLLLLGYYFDKFIEKKKIIKSITLITTIIFILSVALLWNATWISKENTRIGYTAGFNDIKTIIKSEFPGYLEITNNLNYDVLLEDNILTSVTSLGYFIKDSHKRLISDKYENELFCLSSIEDSQKLKTLQDANIRFLILDGKVKKGDIEGLEMKQKIIDFANKSLEPVYASSDNHLLYKVPKVN